MHSLVQGCSETCIKQTPLGLSLNKVSTTLIMQVLKYFAIIVNYYPFCNSVTQSKIHGAYTISGQNFKDFPGPYFEI